MKLEHFAPAAEWWSKAGRNRDRWLRKGEEILPPHELIQQYQEKRASLNADVDRILVEIEGILG